MPRYKLFLLRDSLVEKFRESAPKSKPYSLRAHDYEEAGEIEAAGPYGAWKLLQEPENTQGAGRREFGVGDALQLKPAELVILNHWGFDQAEWRQCETEANETEVLGGGSRGIAAGSVVTTSQTAAPWLNRKPSLMRPIDERRESPLATSDGSTGTKTWLD